MQTIILCAGKGKRLHPLTMSRSKAMLPILGKPMVVRVMEQIIANGLRDFILVASPGDAELMDYFDSRDALPADVKVVYQKQPDGSANALQCAAGLVDGDFLLSACDNLTSPAHIFSLLKTWRTSPQIDALLTLMPVSEGQVSSTAIVELDGNVVKRIVEKPRPGQASSNIASLPLYCFRRKFLEYLPGVRRSQRNEYELQDAIQALITGGGYVAGCRVEKRLTLTKASDLIDINRHYLDANQDSLAIAGIAGAGVKFIPPVYVEPGASIGSQCIIGPYVYLEHDCVIGERAVISNSVILRGSRIATGHAIDCQVVSDR
jgi:NDP-sugar pyrophosphorylase family protein